MTKIKRRLRFTDKWIAHAKPETYTDLVEMGLRLRVSPSGRKTFFHQYRLFGVGAVGKRGQRGAGPIKKDLLGHWPGLSLQAARDRVRDRSEKIRTGYNPRATTGAPTGAPTFGDVAQKALADDNASTTQGDLTDYLLPRLGPREIDTITRKELGQVLNSKNDKGEVANDPKVPSRGARVFSTIKKVFAYADENFLTGEDWIDPTARVRGVFVYKSPGRDRVLSRDELLRVWAACGDAGHDAATKLLMLLGQRSNAVSQAKWEEFDFDEAVWTTPKENMKGKKGDHVVPLSRQAMAVLTAIKETRGPASGPFVFSNDDGRTPTNNWSRFKKALDKKTKVTGWRIHDLRHTVFSGMLELEVEPHVISRVAGHSLGRTVSGTTKKYLHNDLADPKRVALQRWADSLFPPADDNVVKLDKEKVA